MIYVTGSSGLIGKCLSNKVKVNPITFRKNVPNVNYYPNSTLIHLSSSITTRNTIDDIEQSFYNDVYTPLKIFEDYLKNNPQGKIIFLSSAGDLHSSITEEIMNENSTPRPKSIYGAHKILLENYIELLHENYSFTSIVFRVSNVYSGKSFNNRVNGLVDKLITSEEKIEIYANLNTIVDIIHVDDLTELILKSVYKKMNTGHFTFLVGNETYKICDIIDIISSLRRLDISIKKSNQKTTFVNLDCTKVKEYFSWTCQHFLKDLKL
jgi:nucleoside-diphosphate-sugar epimerase